MASAELVYKIQDTATGLYSTGGYEPKWTRDGKSWKTMGQLKTSLKLYKRGHQFSGPREIPATWTVVEYKLVSVKRTRAREVL
jgi:hypothetical protein